jgi:hypothetical protein
MSLEQYLFHFVILVKKMTPQLYQVNQREVMCMIDFFVVMSK